MASLLRRGLVEEGHAADVATTGEDAVWMAQSHPYEAIVLDVMLPGLSGFETCRQLRNAGVWSPVLMLTARDGVDDRVLLHLGEAVQPDDQRVDMLSPTTITAVGPVPGVPAVPVVTNPLLELGNFSVGATPARLRR